MDGPIYIYLKDAGDYTTRWIESGLMVDIARENNGSLFTFDYRYFGTNRPTELVTNRSKFYDKFSFAYVEEMQHLKIYNF